MQRTHFPPSFVWGSATASYQIEGAVAEDGRGPSIWDTFSHTPGRVANGDTGDIADDHYHLYADDVAIMADLGLDAYRFSIAWPRIQADGSGPVNAAGIGFYRRLAEQLLERGITPWATLYHWDLPQTLEDRDGWLNRDTALRFAEYSARVAEELGDIVKHWITLNEPWCSAFLGYGSGHHAPGRQEGSRAARAAHHLLLGHGLAMPALRDALPSDAQVGITLNLYSVKPASDAPADLDAARRIDGLSNRLFLDPVLRGAYPEDVVADLGEQAWFAGQSEDLPVIAAPIDFLGINYYSRHTVRAGEARVQNDRGEASAYPGSESIEFVDTGAPRTFAGWPIHPDGMVDVLEQAHAIAPELPLYITENGSTYVDTLEPDGSINDVERTDYLAQHVGACLEAVEKGLPLAGYFVWSLIDNFEWAWGYSRRFGIVHVDFESQKRTPKRSARWLKDFLAGEDAPA
ncbi:beta-glucosidase [Microbacterium paludicola]|uniref:Beta-glucosidase n=1 Tax=Microbacterium paludicola TaxID=300019 RepID=A0A4Y9FXQ5_9MICO|nr:GH1 family beta-glucosidase [Microbacterium paludicola]MBF0815940.1 beta-glucosidase [Microbacterium paludicola]TFU33411.1 beta-glucosidase [Microbacterium paludicola]